MTNAAVMLVLLAAFFHAAWNAMLRGGRNRFWGMCVMAVSAGTVSLAVIPFVPLPAVACLPFAGISALFHVVYNVLLVRMYRHGDLGHTYPIARGSSPLLVSLGGAWFASEHLRPATMAGIVLISVGIFALALGGGKAHRGAAAAASATGCSIAAYSVTDALGVRASGNAIAYTAWMMLISGILVPITFTLIRRNELAFSFREHRAEYLKAAVGGVVSVVAYAIVIWAMKHAPMGPVSALRETSVLFAVLLGTIFLRESFTARKMVSATLIVLGAACLHAGG